MFRISNFMRDLARAEASGSYPASTARKPPGPVVI